MGNPFPIQQKQGADSSAPKKNPILILPIAPHLAMTVIRFFTVCPGIKLSAALFLRRRPLSIAFLCPCGIRPCTDVKRNLYQSMSVHSLYHSVIHPVKTLYHSLFSAFDRLNAVHLIRQINQFSGRMNSRIDQLRIVVIRQRLQLP